MSVAPRPPSKDRKNDGPPAAQGDGAGSDAGTHNLVSAELINPVDKREVYSDQSDEDMVGGAYGGYTAELMDGDIPVDSEDYLSDATTDSEMDHDYRTTFALPTPPCLRLESVETVYRVISDDDNLDMSSYFSDADPDNNWTQLNGVKEFDEDIDNTNSGGRSVKPQKVRRKIFLQGDPVISYLDSGLYLTPLGQNPQRLVQTPPG